MQKLNILFLSEKITGILFMEERKKPNWFVRILIIAFCILLASMIAYRYITIEPKAEISGGLITLLFLLLILVLAESFDNFSVGKLISISREVKKKERDVEKLEKQNTHLLSQLISLSNTQSQNQNHTNVYGDYHATPTVQKASETDVQEKQSSDAASAATPNGTSRVATNWRRAEELALTKYLQQRSLHRSNVIVEAKLVSQFQGIDPISSMQPVFDAYIKLSEHETFVEMRPAKLSLTFFRDRLYVMLSKINHYRTAKRVEAHLDLVLMKLPGEEPRAPNDFARMLESFEPAIASGLLKIHEIEFTADEAASCRDA
ncbi:hypothetical protein P3W85_45145 [Cupriavidus basilensis]|uniref:Uncharacterized protein n=1 Tax=Cupriavidus basilensis TaxID=68895 RepID=A0ABT6B5A3_9BURK|nr:hypothetical protein [Cupriavidus basilensis]MDF3840062.1 hypothetical protein [Cupriavidus basilensis]